jgi:YD repeat-containing protein
MSSPTGIAYDANGNLASDGTNSYGWNARNQLVTITGGTGASFQYDGLSRRTSKTVNGVAMSFLYDNVNVVQELSGGTPLANLVNGIGVDQRFLRSDTSGTFSYLTDGLPSEMALANGAGVVTTRAGVAQVIGNRGLSGKRVRLTGWIKCDSLLALAYIKIYCTTLKQDEDVSAPTQVGNTTPWTKVQMEMDVPKDTYQVWAWLLYNAPAQGRVYFDDASLEIIGAAKGSTAKPAPPARPKGANTP